jgi:hypothetical protein
MSATAWIRRTCKRSMSNYARLAEISLKSRVTRSVNDHRDLPRRSRG